MPRIDQQSRRTWRLIWITGLLSLLAVGFVQVTLNAAARAADQALEGAIEDDPTVAPDSEESADNNVSFPVDI